MSETLTTKMVWPKAMVAKSTHIRTIGPTRLMSISAMATVCLVFPSDMAVLTRVTVLVLILLIMTVPGQ